MRPRAGIGQSPAPFLVGVGISVAATGVVFGWAPVAVGILPFMVGAATWLRRARDELDATVEREVGEVVEGSPAPPAARSRATAGR